MRTQEVERIFMNMDKDKLSRIGKLIGVYRESYRKNTQNNFTICSFCDGVCSPNTLKNIEAGGISRSKAIYIGLIEKLNLKFEESVIADEALDILIEKLIDYVELYNINGIKDICEKILKILNHVKSVIYYNEIYEIIREVLNYYTKDILIDSKRIEVYIAIIDKNIFYFNDILKNLLFAKIKTRCVIDLESYRSIVKCLKLDECHMTCTRLNLLHYYLVIEDYINMEKLICELERIFTLEGNDIRLIDTYDYAIILYVYTKKYQIDDLLSKINHVISNKNIPSIKLCEIYSNIGSFYHKEKNYRKALAYYNRMLDYYDENYLPHLIYIADCQNRLNIEVDIPLISNEVLLGYPTELRIMYKYFAVCVKEPEFVRQNYIIKQVLPYLNNETNIDIFRFELNKLVKKTGNYKSIYLFDSYLSKLES